MAYKRKTKDKYLLWASYPWDVATDEQWEEYFEEMAEINDWPEDVMTEDFKYRLMYDEIETRREDEMINLDVSTEGQIIAIADLGLWNGRRSGYRLLDENNISAIFREMSWDQCEYYCDRYDVWMRNTHHDGTNYILFRELKNVNVEHFLDMIYEGKPIDSKTLCRYTRSLRPYIAKVYGW